MPGWLWETVFQYPLREGDTRTQYSDGSTFVGPLKEGMRHGKGAYFFQDGSRWVGRDGWVTRALGSIERLVRRAASDSDRWRREWLGCSSIVKDGPRDVNAGGIPKRSLVPSLSS